MKELTGMLRNAFKAEIRSPLFFRSSLVLAMITFADLLLYYTGILPNSFPAGYCWVLSLLFLYFAFSDLQKVPFKKRVRECSRSGILLCIAVTLLYFISHLIHYANAPWNDYGLFDDAAWDIYIAGEHCFNGDSFEIICWDGEIGRISRELLFHYYISILFRLFGYNMTVFNMGLILLGYITVLFTSLLTARIFKDPYAGFLAGLFLNFYPLHFTQVFMGHRYAICAPPVMISLYFIHRAVKKRSIRCAAAGGVFAAFSMESAVMGKQYLWALLAAGMLHGLILLKNKRPLRDRLPQLAGMLTGFAVCAAPLYAYIFTHGDLYRIREADLTRVFFEQLSTEGLSALWQRTGRLAETLFMDFSPNRQFSTGFPVLPWYICIPAAAGLGICLYRKQFIPPLMLAITAAGNIVSECYDFRLLLAAPFLAILIAAALHACAGLLAERLSVPAAGRILSTMLLAVILAAPVRYLWQLSLNPQGQYLLNHTDLAVCRFIQDIAAGAEDADFTKKSDEFRRSSTETDYEVLAATKTSYAHIHAFLQPFDSRRILSLFGDFPYTGRSTEELRDCFVLAIDRFPAGKKDLLLIMEYDPQLDPLLHFLHATGLCEETLTETTLDGEWICMLQYRIRYYDLPAFKQKICELYEIP